jgi:hypoxanthine phosphoribosyltransferase
MIAIGGGGYVPARILRSFLKKAGSPNIPIQAIGLSLYESLPEAMASGTTTPGEVEQPGTKVTRTQWLDLTSLGEMGNLVGKRILIVDEVDDTRTTLEYAVKELEKDVELARQRLGLQDAPKTTFSIFVLHVSFPKSRAQRIHGLRVNSITDTPDYRTRTSQRRAPSQRTSSRTTTSPRGPSQIGGSATRGRPLTLRSTTPWPRSSRA